jgi:hypothetical protein
MRKRLLLIIGVVGMLGAANLEAQVRFGGQVGYANDADLGLGARVQVGLPSLNQIDFIGSFDLYFPSSVSGVDVNYWEINANLKYDFPINSPTFGPYLGTGLNLAHVSVSSQGFGASDTDLGLNIMGGTTFRAGSMTPFAELRVEVGGGEQVILAGGLLF